MFILFSFNYFLNKPPTWRLNSYVNIVIDQRTLSFHLNFSRVLTDSFFVLLIVIVSTKIISAFYF